MTSHLGHEQRIEGSIPLGRYRHFKGGIYEVLGEARHSETEEVFVVYRPLNGAGWWTRPRTMFQETISFEGQTLPRFSYLGPIAE